MRNQFSKTLGCALALACLVFVGMAQTPPAPPIIPNPTYTSIPMEIMVNRPAAEVWKRVGKFCDIGEWFQIACTITAGKDGEFGAVRSVANEVLVGKTELSYTYTQPVRVGVPYILYHGTLEARPVSEPRPNWSTRWCTTTQHWRTMLPGKKTGSKGTRGSCKGFRT